MNYQNEIKKQSKENWRTITIDKETHAELKALAVQTGMLLHRLAEQAIAEHVRRHRDGDN